MPSQVTKTTQETIIRFTEAEVREHFSSLCPGFTLETKYRYVSDPYESHIDKYFDGFELTKVTEIE